MAGFGRVHVVWLVLELFLRYFQFAWKQKNNCNNIFPIIFVCLEHYFVYQVSVIGSVQVEEPISIFGGSHLQGHEGFVTVYGRLSKEYREYA